MQIQFFLGLLSAVTYVHATALTLLEPIIENVVHLQTSLPPPGATGVWRKKLIWKARWVQEWKSEKKYRPVWRKVWSPVEIREWIPVARPPPETHKPEEEHISFHPPDDDSYPPSGPPVGPPVSSGPPGPTVGPPVSSGPPDKLPPFRPLPDRPPGNYGPPAKPSPSTELHPVPDNPPPEWPAPPMQELLQSYHTIQQADYQKPLSNYHINSPDPERQVVDYMQPPRLQAQLFRPPTNSSGDPRNLSPYANKLAQAVVREKLNQSLNPTERPSGLTDVVYKSDSPSSTTPSSLKNIEKTATDSNVFIVTPVNFV